MNTPGAFKGLRQRAVRFGLAGLRTGFTGKPGTRRAGVDAALRAFPFAADALDGLDAGDTLDAGRAVGLAALITGFFVVAAALGAAVRLVVFFGAATAFAVFAAGFAVVVLVFTPGDLLIGFVAVFVAVLGFVVVAVALDFTAAVFVGAAFAVALEARVDVTTVFALVFGFVVVVGFVAGFVADFVAAADLAVLAIAFLAVVFAVIFVGAFDTALAAVFVVARFVVVLVLFADLVVTLPEALLASALVPRAAFGAVSEVAVLIVRFAVFVAVVALVAFLTPFVVVVGATFAVVFAFTGSAFALADLGSDVFATFVFLVDAAAALPARGDFTDDFLVFLAVAIF